MSASHWVHLDVERVKRETDNALLVVLVNGDEHWIPKSQIDDSDNYGAGDTNCTISIPRWLAVEKDIEIEE